MDALLSSWMQRALDLLAVGVVLVGPRDEVLFANASARHGLQPKHLLRHDGTLRLGGGLRRALTPFRDLGTRGCLQRALLGDVQVLALGPSPAESLQVLYVFHRQDWHGTGHCLRDFYRLTNTESAVVEHWLSGQSTGDIAAHFHVGRATVRTHLRTVFAKLDVRSQRELMALLSQGPLGQLRW